MSPKCWSNWGYQPNRRAAENLSERRHRDAPHAGSDFETPIGCTQSTEIISTEGVVLSGSLPHGCDLATMYTAAVTTQAAHAKEAQMLIELLIGADQRALRAAAGFLGGLK